MRFCSLLRLRMLHWFAVLRCFRLFTATLLLAVNKKKAHLNASLAPLALLLVVRYPQCHVLSRLFAKARDHGVLQRAALLRLPRRAPGHHRGVANPRSPWAGERRLPHLVPHCCACRDLANFCETCGRGRPVTQCHMGKDPNDCVALLQYANYYSTNSETFPLPRSDA